MQRMTDALSRMLNDPSTRLAMRTLGDREEEMRSLAANRSYQRSESEQQMDEGEDVPSDSTNNNPTEEIQPEINPDGREDEQIHENDATEETNETVEAMEQPGTGNIKQVPDITVEHCSQSMAPDQKELDSSSHEDKNDTSSIETENKSGKEQKVLGASAYVQNINQQLGLLEKCSVDKSGL